MGLLIILCGLAALIWVLHLIRWGNVPLAGLAILVVGTVGGPSLFALDGPIQISADRVLWAIVMVMFVVNWRLGKVQIGSLTRGDWMLLFLAGWLAISTQRGGPVPGEASPFARWLFYICLPLGMYVIARGSKVHARDLKWIINVLILLSIYLGWTGWCELQGWHALVYPRYIVDPKVWEFYGRARGPLLNPAANGIILTIGLGAAALQWIQAGRLGKLLYGLAIVIISTGVYATLTRGVWVGGLLALAIIALYHLPRWVSVVGLASAVVLGGGLMLNFRDQLVQLKRDKHLSAAEAEKSLQLRPLLAIVALEMFKDKPVAGVGYGHYFAHSGPYHDTQKYGSRLATARPYMQHNVLLSVLVDAGLLGLIPLLGVLCCWTAYAGRITQGRGWSAAENQLGILMWVTLGSYLVNGMFQDVSVIPMVHMFVFYIAGLTVSVSLNPSPDPRADQSSTRT